MFSMFELKSEVDMQRPIEILTLLDYVKLVLKHEAYESFNNEPFETILISYSEQPVVSEIIKHLNHKNFEEVLSLIISYEKTHSQLKLVYHSIKKDYFNLTKKNAYKAMRDLLQDKYGIMECDEMIALLDLQAHFIAEHEYT